MRLSQKIRPYTSVRVNWTRKTLVFVNEPLPIEPRTERGQGGVVGIDRGVTHMVADNTGEFHDLLWDRLKELDNKVRRLQRSQERSIRDAGYSSRRELKKAGAASNSFDRRDKEIQKTRAAMSRIVEDSQHKLSRRLVENNDIIVMEKLNLTGMSRKCKAKVNPDNPGQFLPNGQTAKRRLNQALRVSSLSQFGEFVKYKAGLSGAQVVEVDPKNTSRRCSSCGHVAQENRESQAVFLCKQCGFTANADTNASVNILDRAMRDHREELNEFWGEEHPLVRAYQPGPAGSTGSQQSPMTHKPHVLASC